MSIKIKCYDIDGWLVQLPQAWRLSVDQAQQPPQIIFDTDELVTVYISTWDWKKTKTGKTPDVENVSSLFLQAYQDMGIELLDGLSKYFPKDFSTYVGKGTTKDGCTMVACAICTAGRAITIYFVCEDGADFEKYLEYIKSVRQM